MIKQKLKYAVSLLKSYNSGKANKTLQYTAKVLNRNKPANYQSADKLYFDHELQTNLPDVYVYEIGKAIVTKEGFVYVNGSVLSNTDTPDVKPKQLADVVWSNTHYALPQGRYIVVHTIWSDNYNHWLSEAFQKLYAVKKHLGNSVKDYTLLLPATHNKPYIIESLKLAGITQIHFIPENSYVIAENVASSTLAAVVGNYQPDIIGAIRNDFHANINVLGNTATRNIYISRKKADKRFLLNEEAVLELLQKYGFEVLYFEDLSFAEQVKTMAATKNLVALHGAGLTNMMFMPQGGNVLEMRLDGDTHMNLFYGLCDAAGLNYYYQLCKGDADTKDVHAVNLVADIPALEQNIKAMLAH